jgi:uncharacterized membrane protein
MKKFIKSIWGIYAIASLVLTILWFLNNKNLNPIAFIDNIIVVVAFFALFVSFITTLFWTKFEKPIINNVFGKSGLVIVIGFLLLILLSLTSCGTTRNGSGCPDTQNLIGYK